MKKIIWMVPILVFISIILFTKKMYRLDQEKVHKIQNDLYSENEVNITVIFLDGSRPKKIKVDSLNWNRFLNSIRKTRIADKKRTYWCTIIYHGENSDQAFSISNFSKINYMLEYNEDLYSFDKKMLDDIITADQF